MGVAGDNEKDFRNLLSQKYSDCEFGGKKRYTLDLLGFEEVETSVDESIHLPDGRTILVEVDSGNMAKLLAGHYALLNGLYNESRDNVLFLVVHYYIDKKNNGRPYSSHRTLKNLNAIQSFSPGKNWLAYNAINRAELVSLLEESKNIIEFANRIWKN